MAGFASKFTRRRIIKLVGCSLCCFLCFWAKLHVLCWHLRIIRRFASAFDFDAPFFVDRRGEPLSRGRFNEKLKKVMCLVEPELPGRFPSKSFRIGATSDSYALNIPIDDIGNLGRWAVVFSSLHALCNRGSIQASRYREILRYCLVATVYCW